MKYAVRTKSKKDRELIFNLFLQLGVRTRNRKDLKRPQTFSYVQVGASSGFVRCLNFVPSERSAISIEDFIKEIGDL